MTGATGELSLVLSVEQLVVLGGFLGEPVPGYVAGALEEVTRSRREAALSVARQSLVRRGILIPGEPFQIPLTAARLLEIVCRPELSVAIHHGSGPHWSPNVARIAAVPDASVELLADGDAFRLTPLHTASLLDRIRTRCKLSDTALPPPGAAVTVPLGVLRAAAAATDPASAVGLLKDGGVPEVTAESAGTALAGGRRYAVSIVLRAGAGQRTGSEVAWVAGTGGYWLLPPVLTPIGGNTTDVRDTTGGRGDGITVRLQPASADDIRNALTISLPIDS